MREFTPEQFGKKLAKIPKAVKEQDKNALKARADVTQKIVTLAATRAGGLGRKYAISGRWVQIKTVGDTAEVRLRTGFGFLEERGSYKHPAYYRETPKKVTSRRRANAAKRGQTINESGLLSVPPYGAFPSVAHPAQVPHPFWKLGVDASRKPGYDAYSKKIRNSITDAMR